MRIKMFMLDEQDNVSDLVETETVLVIDGYQYAVVKTANEEHTFCKVTTEFDGTMRLSDILDDNEFERVRSVYLTTGAPQ